MQRGRPEGRPLIAAEWTELTAIGIMDSSKEPMLQSAVQVRSCQCSAALLSTAPPCK
jgi:hypothetical protein